MSAEHVIPFPESCPRSATCIQESRISVLEERAKSGQTQLDRIETKVDALRNWQLAAALSLIVALISAVIAQIGRAHV